MTSCCCTHHGRARRWRASSSRWFAASSVACPPVISPKSRLVCAPRWISERRGRPRGAGIAVSVVVPSPHVSRLLPLLSSRRGRRATHERPPAPGGPRVQAGLLERPAHESGGLRLAHVEEDKAVLGMAVRMALEAAVESEERGPYAAQKKGEYLIVLDAGARDIGAHATRGNAPTSQEEALNQAVCRVAPIGSTGTARRSGGSPSPSCRWGVWRRSTGVAGAQAAATDAASRISRN